MTRAANRAFTILELLVAVTITLFVAALMLAVTTGVLNLWRRTQAELAQAAAAEQVFDLLEQDLQSAIWRRDANRWFAVDLIDSPAGLANHGWMTAVAGKPPDGGSLRPLPPAGETGESSLASARFGLSGAWLRFITANVEAGGSLPAAIAYQIVRRPVNGNLAAANSAPARYSLFRSAVGPADTFACSYDVTANAYASLGNTPPASSNAFREPRNVMNPSQANLLAANVVDFGCWLYVRNPDGSLRLIYPSSPTDVSHHAPGNSSSFDSRFPEVVDVMIRILTGEGAAQLEAIEAGRIRDRPPGYAGDADWWWGVVEANSKVFTRRIEIRGTAQ